VLCRFTAFVAVDTRVVTEGGKSHRVVQPVEAPAGWAMFDEEASVPMAKLASASFAMPMMQPAVAMPPPPTSGAPTSGAPMSPPGMPAPAPMMPRGFAGGARAAADGFVGAIRGRGRGKVGRSAAEPVPPQEQIDTRDLVAREAQRLRDAADRPDFERRELLEDLGSRLAALSIGELAPLVEALKPDEIAKRNLDDLWEHVLRTLDAYAGRSGGPEPTTRRSAFWKRG
jgi:Ca-activated chloride channel family protein